MRTETEPDRAGGPRIATVTLNPAIDKTVSVSGLVVGKTNRVIVEQIDAGGKGVNVAKALSQFGCEVLVLGFVAGNFSQLIHQALARRKVVTDLVEVAGETRINLKIKDNQTGSETEINEPGFPVSREQLKVVEQKIEAFARPSRVVVFSGSLPPGVPADAYARFIHIARQRGAKAILDTAGEALRQGITAGPDLVKPNLAEAEELTGKPIRSERELGAALRTLIRSGAKAAVISCGTQGAVGTDGSISLHARPPRIHASSSIGSGDAMVAALAWCVLRQASFEEAFALAVAAGTATAAMNGSGTAELPLVRNLLAQVHVERLEEPAEVQG